MFAALELEKDPLQWAQMPQALKTWVEHFGLLAAVGLFIYCLAYLIQRSSLNRWLPTENRTSGNEAGNQGPLSGLGRAIGVLAGLSLASYLAIGAWALLFLGGSEEPEFRLGEPVIQRPTFFSSTGDALFFLGGLFAIVAVCLPLALSLSRLRLGRIIALARLSLKEAFRKRVVWAFSVIAVVFLFAGWFVRGKPEDEIRNYVRLIYWSLPPLFLLVATWLGAFSIPTDVKNQSIHTIVTKPVERFEIVLGRFLGYSLLLTVGLLVLTALGLLYLLREVRDEAKQESMTARMPIFADVLEFYPGFIGKDGTRDRSKQESVGREWSYRSYIGGPSPNSPERQYAIWSFKSLPTYFVSKPVYLEFTFDIFRLTKGKENRGVYVTFTFVDGSLNLLNPKTIQDEREKVLKKRDKMESAMNEIAEGKKKQGLSAAEIQEWRAAQLEEIQNDLIAEFAYYDVSGQEVRDYHTQALGGEQREQVGKHLAQLFTKLAKQPPQAREGLPAPPALHVLVSVDAESAAQKLGVAKRDLYVLAAEGPFWANFFKGMVGMWCTIMLVMGIALAASTYLSGVISFLVAMFLLGMGFFKDYVQEIATGAIGGPLDSLVRLATGKQHSAPLDQSPTTNLIKAVDDVYRSFMSGFMNVIPDVDRFDLHQYVANGFDISWMPVLLLDNLVPLLAYLIPCAVLAYYLMKFREVANPT
jgi:hypothetical protein